MMNFSSRHAFTAFLFTLLFMFLSFQVHSQSLQWSTYLNTAQDESLSGMTKDNDGNIYIIGGTKGNGYPVTAGAEQSGLDGATGKMVVTKISAATGSILWSTYFGGTDDNISTARFYWDSISHSLCITGNTSSDHFPVVNGNPKTSTSLFSQIFCQFDDATGNILFSTYVFPVNTLYINYRTVFEDGKFYIFTISDVFTSLLVAKIDLTTHQFVFNKSITVSTGTFMGISGVAYVQMAVSNGEVFVNGSTSASDYPVTPGAYQTQYPSGAVMAYYVTKLDAAGNIAFSTYANAVDNDYSFYYAPMAVNNREVAIASTFGNSLPVSPGGIRFDSIEQTNIGLLKLDRQTGAILYATYLGANNDYFPVRELRYVGKDLLMQGNVQSAYLPVTPNALQRFNSYGINEGSSGGDCFLMHIDSANRIVYCSYLGGNKTESFQNSVVSGRDIYFFGTTGSSNFPTTPNATQQLLKGNGITSDMMLVKYNLASRSITYSSYLGSAGFDSYGSVPVISGDYLYVAATAYNSSVYPITMDFPVTPDAFQRSVIGSYNPSGHQYVAKISTVSGKLAYGSYIGSTLTGGGENAQSLVVKGNDLFLAGTTSSNDYPVTPGAVSTTQKGFRDIFVTKISLCGSDLTGDTLTPGIMSVCTGSVTDTIRGAVPQLSNAAAIIRNGITDIQPAAGNFTYQWQLSTDSSNWTNISGAVQVNYRPEPVQVKTYFRRIAKGIYCANLHISTVTILQPNGFSATKPNVGGDGTFFSCPGSNLILGTPPAAGSSYSWQPSANLSGSGSAQATFNNPSAGSFTYILFSTDGNGCTATDTATLFNYKASAGPDRYLCPGRNTQIGTSPLAGLAGVTYTWSPATGLSCSNCAQPFVSASGTYVLTVNVPLPQGGNCITKDTIIVNQGSLLTDPAGPDQTICNQSVVTLGTAPVPGYTYNWAPGVFLSGITNVSQPTFNQLNASIYLLYNPVNYIVTASNPAGCTTIDTVKVYLVDPYAGYRICRPGPLGRNDYTRGQAAYEWVDVTSGTEMPVEAGELSSTTISNPRAMANADIGDKTYRLKMTWNGVTCSSDVLVFNGCGGCPGVDVRFASKSGCPNVINNDSVSLYVNNPDPGYIYVWTPSVGLNKDTGTVVFTGVTTGTEYTVTAINIFDTAVNCSNTIKVNFFAPSAPAFHAPDKIICKNESATIGLPAVAGLDYLWTNDVSGGGIVDATSDPMITGVQTMNYYVKVTDPASNCFITDTVLITIPSIPVDGGPSRPSCSNGGFTIGTPPVAGFSYNWLPATGLSSSTVAQPTVLSNGTDIDYILSVTDAVSGCVAKDTVSIFHTDNPSLDPLPVPAPYCEGGNGNVQLGNPALNNVIYSWSPATDLSDPTIAQPIANPSVTTTYVLTADFSGACATPAIASVTVTVIPKPDVAVSVTNNCTNSLLTTSTSATFATYTWSPLTGLSDPYSANTSSTTSVPLTYQVAVYDQTSGCADTATAIVVPPVVVSAGDDREYCEGNSVTIGNTAGAGLTYSWTPATGLTNYTISEPATLATLPPGNYTYVVTASDGICAKTDSIVLKVNPAPLIDLVSAVTICRNASVQIGVTPDPLVTYTWSPVAGLSDATIGNPVASPSQSTVYSVNAVDFLTGCSVNGSTTVTVNNTGAPSVDATGSNTCNGVEAQLNAIVTGTGTFSYVWTPDIGFVSSRFISNPTVMPATTTTYQVLVTNTVNGCATTDDAILTVTDTCGVVPLTWLSFTAQLQNNNTILQWQVNMEINNAAFIIERSVDGEHWKALSSLPSLGNTNAVRLYSSIDAAPLAGISYYRIKQLDLNGGFSYSEIRAVKNRGGEPGFVIYPNPAHDVLQYEIQGVNSNINAVIKLYTAEGRLVNNFHVNKSNGELSMAHLPSGIYIVSLEDKGGFIKNKKVVLQR